MLTEGQKFRNFQLNSCFKTNFVGHFFCALYKYFKLSSGQRPIEMYNYKIIIKLSLEESPHTSMALDEIERNTLI